MSVLKIQRSVLDRGQTHSLMMIISCSDMVAIGATGINKIRKPQVEDTHCLKTIYIVMDNKEREEIYMVYQRGDTVYLLQDGKAVKYKKISNVATYFAVDTPDDF